MFVNTRYYSELATEFKKNGNKYPYYDEYMDIFTELNRNKKRHEKIQFPIFDDMSHNAQKFANHWLDIFRDGMSVGGVPITGEHAVYLNAVNIEVTTSYEQNIVGAKRTTGYREPDFPKFWDEDFRYFWTCEIAKHGVSSIEAYLAFIEKVGDIGLIVDEENLRGGLNHMWLKPRGVGASWKGANKANYNQYLRPGSKTFIFAHSEQFLGGKDGFFNKFVAVRNFIQTHCWFLRKEFKTEAESKYIYESGYKELVAGSNIDKGFKSLVAGIITNGDEEKGRGKRGDAIFEEFGSFPHVDKVWNKYEESAIEYGVVHGQARGFGTGGDKKGTVEGYEALQKMFFDPRAYNCVRFKDISEIEKLILEVKDHIYDGKGQSMFTPAFRNITDVDFNGNSIVEVGKAKLDARRVDWKAANDPALFIEKCAELPYIPRESFGAIGENIFPIELLRNQLDYLTTTNIDRQLVSYGELEKTSSGIRFKLNPERHPYEAYPYTGVGKDSCVCMFQKPFKIRGKVPRDMYRIVVDPYQNDDGGPSVGAIYVIENVNRYTSYKGDVIVAWYVGRPKDDAEQTEFCNILFGLAEMYGCKIGLETGAESAVVSHAKNRKNLDSKGRKLTRYLEAEFQMAHNVQLISKRKNSKEFGMHVTPERRRKGMVYLKDWLLRPRGMNGLKVLRNIDFIFDRGLLKELIEYKGKNADRLSAKIVSAYYEKELDYVPDKGSQNKGYQDSFFKQSLFQ